MNNRPEPVIETREITLPRATWDKLDLLARREGIQTEDLAAGAVLAWVDVFSGDDEAADLTLSSEAVQP